MDNSFAAMLHLLCKFEERPAVEKKPVAASLVVVEFRREFRDLKLEFRREFRDLNFIVPRRSPLRSLTPPLFHLEVILSPTL